MNRSIVIMTVLVTLMLAAGMASAAIAPQLPGKLLASLKITDSVASPQSDVFHSGLFFNATRRAMVPIVTVGTQEAIYGIELETYTTVWTAAVNDFSGTSVASSEANILVVISQLCPSGANLCIAALNMSNAQVVWDHALGSNDVLPPIILSHHNGAPAVFTINNYDVVGYLLASGSAVFRATPSISGGTVNTICVPAANSDEVAVILVDNTPTSGVYAQIYNGVTSTLTATVTFPNTSSTYDTMQPLAACVATTDPTTNKVRNVLFVAANTPAQGSLYWSEFNVYRYDLTARVLVDKITLLLLGYGTAMWTQVVNGKQVLLVNSAWMPSWGTTPTAGRLFALDCATFKGINTDMFILPNTLFTAVVSQGAASNLLMSYHAWTADLTNVLTYYTPFPTKSTATPAFNVTLPAVPELNEQTATTPVFAGAQADKIVIGIFDKRVEEPDRISELFIFIYSA